mgnify:CR=1 FL=1
MTDSVFAYGDIPSYSLFSGIGNWNDTTLWSHLPPLRHRNALIKGNVNITTDTYCKDIAIHSGSLEINPGSLFILQNLDLYENKASLHSGGMILLSGRITFHKTFEEPGKWYFISFPFDVYPPGIDLHFEQKDATPNDGGNYFYVQSYNGDKRASSNQSAGNWEVVPIRPDNVPLFEKNQRLPDRIRRENDKPNFIFFISTRRHPRKFCQYRSNCNSFKFRQFFRQSRKPWLVFVRQSIPRTTSINPNRKKPGLWMEISMYMTETVIKPITLNSNYALPPFAAFFVKASSPTELKISSNSTPTKAINIIPTNFPMSKSITEPHPDKQSTEIELPNTENFRFFIKDGQLHLQNIPEAGYIKVFNMMGHCMFQKRIRQGSLVVPFTNLSGMYILQIHSANYQKYYKVVLP